MLGTLSHSFSSWVSRGHQKSHKKKNIKARLAEEAMQADGRMMADENHLADTN